MRQERSLAVFVAAVAAAALGVAALAFTRAFGGPALEADVTLLVVIAVTAAAEAFPLRVSRRSGSESFDVSSAITVGAAITLGPAAAIVAQVSGMIIGQDVRSPPRIKVAFNVAQKALAVGLAGAVAAAVSGLPVLSQTQGIDPRAAAALVCASLTYVAVNSLSVTIVCALAQAEPVMAFVRRELSYILEVELLLLLLAPVTAALLTIEPLLLPLLGAPVYAVWLSGRQATAAHEQARRDPLTAVPNRVEIREVLDARCARGESLGIVLVDIDRFGPVNDTLGHDVGDDLLCEVAERLKSATGSDGVLGRLQADEFAVVMNDADEQAARALASRLIEAFEHPFDVGGLPVALGLTAGVAVVESSLGASEVLRRADVAVFAAKRDHVASAVYSSAVDDRAPERLVLLGSIRGALARDEIVTFFQPQVDLATGDVVAVEALVRWLRPSGELVPPGDFIPYVEHTALLAPLTLRVLDSAIAAQAAWAAAGRRLRVSVNLSVASLLDGGLFSEIEDRLASADIVPGGLEFEITESAFMVDQSRTEQLLSRLTERGVVFSLDDFGTGYSSLGQLALLPVESIKIDRSFVSALQTASSVAIVRSMVELGHSLGLTVVAEGIEDPAVRDRVIELGCDVGQGFLWSRAVPRDDVLPVADRIESLGAAVRASETA